MGYMVIISHLEAISKVALLLSLIVHVMPILLLLLLLLLLIIKSGLQCNSERE